VSSSSDDITLRAFTLDFLLGSSSLSVVDPESAEFDPAGGAEFVDLVGSAETGSPFSLSVSAPTGLLELAEAINTSLASVSTKSLISGALGAATAADRTVSFLFLFFPGAISLCFDLHAVDVVV
jgi:hypothetical protein